MRRREFPASIDPQRAPPGIVKGENVAEPRFPPKQSLWPEQPDASKRD